MCAWQGVGISREGISEALRLAAVALGYPAHLVASHSLRKGGATAMLAVTSDVETVKRFGGWKSDAVHAYLYTDMAAAPNRAKEMLTSKPVLQPQQHTQAPNRVGGRSLDYDQHSDVRCGGPEDPRPEDEEFGDSDDPDWRSARAKLQELERQTGLTFVQRVRLKKQIAKGGVVEPPVFLQRFGGLPEWFAPVSAASSSQDVESAHMYRAVIPEPPFQASADEPSTFPQLFLPEQVFHSSSRRSALPRVVMADNAPRPAGMGHAQLRDWINQWGSAWAFLGLEPGSSMTDVMKAFKADATLRMSALGNAKEILLAEVGLADPPRQPPLDLVVPLLLLHQALRHLLPRQHRLSLNRSPRADPAPRRPHLRRRHRRVLHRAPHGRIGQVPHLLRPLRRHRQTPSRATTTRGWRQKGRNVWEDPYGTVWEEVSDMSDFSEEASRAGILTRTHPVRR